MNVEILSNCILNFASVAYVFNYSVKYTSLVCAWRTQLLNFFIINEYKAQYWRQSNATTKN